MTYLVRKAIPESNKPICSGCFLLGNRLITAWPPYVENLIDVSEITGGVESICPGCEVISQILDPYMTQLKERGMQVGVKIGHHRGIWLIYHHGIVLGEAKRVNIEVMALPIPVTSSHLEKQQRYVFRYAQGFLLTVRERSSPWSLLSPKSPISGYTGSETALALARIWLHDCLTEHVLCPIQKNSHLPTRVLRIESDRRVSLYCSKSETFPYACLSYCWGRKSFPHTTTLNFHMYQDEIPWEELPKTIQDAIIFTYGLGLRFLWVDSLCKLR